MNLSLLAKVGTDVLKGVEVGAEVLATAEGYGPIINSVLSAFLPAATVAKLPAVEAAAGTVITKIDDIVKSVEGLGALTGMSGADKLTTATNIAVATLSDALSLAGHDVQDAALLAKAQSEFTSALNQLVQARVDFLNALKPKS